MSDIDQSDSPEQAALRAAVRDFAGRHADGSAPKSVWPRLTGELGLTALAIPERHDGMGGTLAEVAIAVEEFGRVLLPVPYLSTVLAGAVLADGAAVAFLPGIASGAVTAAFALTGGITATGGRLSGVATHVLDGAEADLFVTRAGGALYAVRAADVAVTPVGTLDQTRSQATVAFRAAPAVAVAGDAGRAEELLRVLLAVESVGAAEHCLDATVAYLKTRVQFGRPIGAFQALRHRCADLAVEVASARATARAAVAAAVSTPDQLPVLAPLAKRHCVDVFWHVAAEMIQLHGGIGFTWEHEAHRYLKRAKSSQLLHGTPAQLRRLVAERAGLT
ncbi:MAG TPA: acyl-CoA dehydrogenase family protein [Mycobacteriales bacterium]|nr:acyl-CoA dehydrogenase family protein [Mycobacteriales bacterium]